MMNTDNQKRKIWQMKERRRRIIAFVMTLSLLISSCGLTTFAESDDYIYSVPVTAPAPGAITSPEPEEGDVSETPVPESQSETETGAEESAGSEELTGTEGEPEESEEPEPVDLTVYEPGILTAEADGIQVTLDYTAEARVPEGTVLTLARAAGGDLYSAMKSAAKVLRTEINETWQRAMGDEAVFYAIALTPPEGNEVHPKAGVTLTCENLIIPANATGFVTGDNAENIDWDGTLTVDFLPDAVGYAYLKQVQIGNITLVHEGADYTVTATYGPDAGFPAGTELKVREILPGTDEYALYSGMTEETLGDDWKEITLERYFDITFVHGVEELEPQADVDVQITFHEKLEQNEETDIQAVHIEENEATVIETDTDSTKVAVHDDEAIDTVTFTSDSFSVYGVVQRKKIVTKVLDAQGHTYEIEVTYNEDAEIPEEAQVKVEEIPEGSDLWEAYRKQTAAALNADDVVMPGLYDITIVDADGNPVEPKAPVSVAFKLLTEDTVTEDIQVVHFTEDIPQELVEAEQQTEQTEVLTEPLAQEDRIESEQIAASVEGDNTVTFNTDGFSVYAFAYTVDFEHVNDKGEKHAWSYPGRGSYAIADILAQIGVTGTIENVSLTRTVDQGGAENALYLTEDRTALVSEEAFTDTFELTVSVDGVVYLFLITDEQVDNRVTAEVYFLNTDGTRTSNAETESGNTLNARINLSNSSANNGDDTYVKVSLDGLGNYVKLNEKFRENDWDSVVFRDMATGTQYSIGVFYNTTDNSITYRVPPGATGIVALSFTAPNGITPDGTTLTITPSLVDSGFSPITPEENDSIGGPASGKWTSDFAWDPIQKYVNNSKENTVVVKPDGNGAPAINTWLRYDYSAANSLNRTEKGVRWTDHATISDNLTLPEHMSFTGTYACDLTNGRIYIGAPGDNNILFGLTLKENMRCTALSIDNGTIHYEITVTNPNRDSSTNELTGEMDNISFITELNAAGITLDENYIASGYYGEEIINTVNITETPGTGNDPVSSHDQVKTRTKQDEGFTVDKESSQDGAYVEAGGTIDYTIRVTNTGTVTIAAADSIVTDTLPAAVYLTDAEISRLRTRYGESITIDGNTITFRTGELAPNATSEVIIHANVKDSKALEQAGYTNESAITNTAFYRGMSDYVASKLHAGKITAEKTSDKTNTTLTDGDKVNFTLTARNDTAYGYTGEVTLTDTLPKYFRVTLFDASGNDITATAYSQPGTYDSGCYIRDSSNHLVPATVVIDWDGRTTVTVRKSDGLAANSRYSVVLTATYDESKVDGRVDDNGNILYTNYVNVNNSQDHTDVTVAVGKIDVDKYVSGATNGGSTVSQPFSDHTEVTYTIHVVNDQSNPYKHDIIVTDTMPRGLVPMGLTVEGTTYESWQAFIDAFGWQEKEATILDGSGSPQSVRVVQAYNGLKLTWTIPNGEGHLITAWDITYKALVRTDELVNQSSGLQELGNTVTAAGREDKEIIVVDVKGVEISKKIVGPGGELLDTIEIGPGSVVTYELTIDNPEHLNTTVTGIIDYLPQGGPQSVFPLSYWVLGSTVLVDETTAGKNEFYLNAVPYANNDANYGRKYWFDNEHNLRFGDISITSGQEKLVQRITLKYPDDPTVLHAMFTDTAWWGRQQKNRYAISGMNPVEVDHTEVTNKKFYVQKSVIGLSKYKNWNYAAISSKDLFNENDVENVFYTVIVANNGTGELHINSLTDVLPPELEFVAIAANDYNAGTHEYTEHAIITSDQTNNPNYVCPSGFTGLKDVAVAASSSTGNTVSFTLNNGEGVDLPEKHLLAFDVQCRLKNDITLTNGQPITNTIQADLDSDAALSKMSITTQRTPDNGVQNNGSCTVVSNDGTHQIAESSVTIHPSNAVVPGILKKAIAYQEQSDTGWIDLNDHTTSINSQSKVRWKITLYNDGAVPLNGGYTLSDSIYEHHVFNSIESFTINGVPKETSVSPFTDMTTEKAGDYNLYTFTFPAGDEYTIPAGGKAELVLVTSFTTGQYQGELDNKAAFYPAQEWDANRVIRGQLEKNDAGTEYTGVSSMDYVNMLGDGATMSYKTVTDKNDPINTAHSYDIAEGKNYITVDDTNQPVTFTNHVQNLTNGTFKKFVMIDRMPEIGDTGVVNAHNQRGSEYSIGFADTLNLTLAFRNGDGTKSIALTGEDYTLEFSEKTSFTTEDWEGTSTWNASPSDAKSFRLKLNAESLTDKINALDDSTLKEAVFPSMWILEVSYDGKLSADGTPGQYAWNSFGYRFTTASDVSLSAEPTKAGVRLKPLPVLKKQVLDSQGIDQGIDTSVQFTFRFYDGQHTLDEVSSLTPIWETTLYQGQAVRLLAQKTVNGVTTGQFIEGQYYTVVEEPVAGYDLLGYEKDGLKQTTQGYCVFKYSNELNTTIVCQNQISGFAPEAEKVLLTTSSRALQNGEFTFELLELSNADLNDLSRTEVIGNRIQQAGNDTAGHVQFDNMEFSAAGTYYYLLREVPGSDTSICYDDTVYLVAVQVDAAGGRFTAIGTYYKVTESDDTDPIKAVQPVPAAELPEFINTESTQIEVQKIWAGDVTTGTSTMVLYRTIGEQAAVPTNKIAVTFNATPDHTPADSGFIDVSYTGSDGSTGSTRLNNANHWSVSLTLDRGVSYDFAYTADGTKILSVEPSSTGSVETTQTIALSAAAKPAENYTYTFTVPSGNRPSKGIVNVTMNGETKQISSSNDWTETFSIAEDTNAVYTVASPNGLITSVTVNEAYNNAPAAGNQTIHVTPTQGDLTMQVPVEVSWSGTPDAGTAVTVTFTNGDVSEQAVLNAPSWSTTKELDRLDDDGELITWSVSAEVTGSDSASVSGAPDTISDSGSVALTGIVAQGMNLKVIRVGGVNIGGFYYTSDVSGSSISYSTSNSAGDLSGYGSGTNDFSSLAVKDNDGNDIYYILVLYSPVKITTNDSVAGHTNAKENTWTTRHVVYLKAFPGEITIKLESSIDWSIITGATNISSTIESIPKFRLIASGGTTDSPLGTATTFADASVGGSGTAFSAIHFKDLPESAAIASDIVGMAEAVQTIDNNNSYTWSNLPAVDNEGHRIYYYVVEKKARANADEVSVSYAYEYNTPNDPASGIRKVIVTNSTARTRGALTIDKLVTVDSQPTTTTYADGTYSFTITGPENYSHTETITVSGGQAEGNITLSDLVPGYYTVTEAETSNGTSLTGRTGGTASGERGIVIYVASGTTAAQNVVTFTNNVETGTAVRNDSVTVNKLDENSEALPGATFTLYSTNDEGTLSDPIRTYGGDDVSSFRISTEDIELGSYLPEAVQGSTILYLQETAAPAGYQLSDTVHNVEITAAVSGPAYDSVSGKWLTTTTYTMTIDGEKTSNIRNTPVGSLEVTKTVTGTFEAGETGFPFTVMSGDLYVTGERTEGTDIYEYKYTGLSETDPQYTVRNGQTITFTGLPAGTYVVTEGDADQTGFVRTTTYTVGNEDPTDDPASAEVTRETPAAVTISNHYRDAQLIIRKAITGVQEDDLDAALAGITFTVTDVTEGDEITRTPEISVTITSENLDSTEGTYFRTLTSADNGIIPDHKYKVTETVTTPDGYILSSQVYEVTTGSPDENNISTPVEGALGGALTLTSDDTSTGEIRFTNTYDLTKLTISKAMSSGSSGGTFFFTVDVRKGDGNAYTGTAYIADGNGGYTAITFTENGLYTASVAAGGSLTIYGLPVGYTYTVTEADADGFRLVSINGAAVTEENHEATGTISADESTAAFINEELVDIEATKTWYQAGDNTNSINSTLTNAQVTFTLQKRIGEGEWANVDIAGNPATMTVTVADPEAWKVSWTNLPKYEGDELISYRVLESGATVSNTAAIMPEPPAAIAEDFATVEGHVNQTAAVNIDNTLPKTSVVVDKRWYEDGEEILWPADIASVTVGLYQSVNGEEAVPVTTGENKNPVTITFGDGAAEAQRTFSGLPVFDVNGSQIIYSIEELGITPAGDGAAMVQVTGNLVTITGGDSWTVGNGAVSNGAAVVTNTMVKTSFDILKVNGNNETQTLSGAEFTLKKFGGKNPDENGYSTVAEYELITVDDHGSASVTGLTDGTYRLYETKAPAGYTAYSGEIEFTITKGEISFTDTQYVTYAKTGDAPGTFTVRNYPGVELPATGGSGTMIYTVAGLMLITLAGVLMIAKRRRFNR